MMTPLTVTPQALDRIHYLLQKRETPAYGIRISLKTKGCSGLSYNIQYADEKNPMDEEVIVDNVHILIDSKALMFILGTQMDYQQTTLKSGFVFENPNEKGRCGCGKSFHV